MQQPFTVIRLNISHSIHLGSHREEYDRSDSILHSDSLYSAIIAAWAILGVNHPILDYEGSAPPDPGFALSSLFPFFRDGAETEPIYFFPTPKPGLQTTRVSLYKDVKWLDTQVFKDYLQHGTPHNSTIKVIGDYATLHPGFESENFMLSEVQPRAYVPRPDETDLDTEIFYIERIFFREHCGLFGLAVFDNEEIKAKVLLALDYLQDAGIGTDRNVGHGQFEYEIGTFEHFSDLPESEHSLNLSMFLPESQEQLSDMLDSPFCCHDIMKRGGWITKEGLLSYRKNSVFMFREGGVFKTDIHVAGKTVDLKPLILDNSSSILRVGRSLFLPLNVG